MSTGCPVVPGDRRRAEHQVMLANGKRMLTLSEVAAHLNCSIPIVRKLIAAGALRAIRLSPRVLRVPEGSVVALLEH